jgi:hypothetical protein
LAPIARLEEEKKMATRFVITGCGRSGTGYMATLLERLGCPCGHEALFSPQRLGWGNSPVLSRVSFKVKRPLGRRMFLTPDQFSGMSGDLWPDRVPGESSWLAVPYLSCLPEGTVVLHQVREPIAVIRSLVRIKLFERPRSPYTVFAEENCDVLRHGTALDRSLHYWIEWNRMADRARSVPGIRYLRYRIEDVSEQLLQEIMAAIGHQQSSEAIAAALAAHPSDYNSRGSRDQDGRISWRTLPEGRVRQKLEEQAHNYGYLPDHRVW